MKNGTPVYWRFGKMSRWMKKKGRRSGIGYRKVNSIAVITGNYRKVICVNVGLCVNR